MTALLSAEPEVFHMKHPDWTGLILPGWQNSNPDHWQSFWEHQWGYLRVEQADWNQPLRGDWQIALEDCLLTLHDKHEQAHSGQPFQVVLIAHSLACHLVSTWAHFSRHTSWIKAAWLVAPPDLSRADIPGELSSWRQPILEPLPFASHVVFSDNDPFCDEKAALGMAEAWGSSTHCKGGAGHLNADSGLGDWPAAHEALLEFVNALN